MKSYKKKILGGVRRMPCPEIPEMSAWIDLMPPNSTLHVVGKVVTNGGNMLPKLVERVPQGINPKILQLVLTIEDTKGPGTDDVAPRDVRFEKPAKEEQYSDVEIYFENELCTSIKVKEVR